MGSKGCTKKEGRWTGVYVHKLFRRDRPDLLHLMLRVTELSQEQKKGSVAC
jgi:hypothetical protein